MIVKSLCVLNMTLLLHCGNLHAVIIPEKELEELIRTASEALRELGQLEQRLRCRPQDEDPIFQHCKVAKIQHLSQNLGRSGVTNMVTSSLASGEMSVLHVGSSDPIFSATQAMEMGSGITFHFKSLEDIQRSLDYFQENTALSINTSIEDLLDTYGQEDNENMLTAFQNYSTLVSSILSDSLCHAVGVATSDNIRAQITGLKAYLNLVISKASESKVKTSCN